MLMGDTVLRLRDGGECSGLQCLRDPMTSPAALSHRLKIAEHALDCIRCAVLFLDENSTVMFANRAAQRMLLEADGLKRVGTTLVACVNGDAVRLREAVACAALAGAVRRGRTPPVTIRIRRGIDRPPLIATALPVRARERGRGAAAQVLLFVADPGAHQGVAPDLLQQAFGLTDREIGVALATLRLNGLPAAARELRIAPSTARSHLQHVFEKTGACNQVALAQMLGMLDALPGADAAASDVS
jgi:DNA-binding CsgD family transcriptional regulator